jgi:hypothetical protein
MERSSLLGAARDAHTASFLVFRRNVPRSTEILQNQALKTCETGWLHYLEGTNGSSYMQRGLFIKCPKDFLPTSDARNKWKDAITESESVKSLAAGFMMKMALKLSFLDTFL